MALHSVRPARNEGWHGQYEKPSPATADSTTQAMTQQTQPTKWKKPMQGFYKINVSAAISEELNLVGIGFVIRDWNGQFIAGKSQAIQGITDLIEGELMAAKEGLHYAWGMGFTKVFLEGNSRNMIDHIKGGIEDTSSHGSILRDIFSFVSRFYKFDCGYVPQECNSVANFLALFAKLEENGIWLEDPPAFIFTALRVDFEA